METKPFSIQSPQNIAQDYGGDKQKIAQGIQMGVLDPTAGLLAGMFIDRMRAAATQEAAPTQTVAQQVFTPPAPPQMPMQAPPPPAGLGALPPGAAPGMGAMAPPPPEMPAPEGPPMEMADGGIATLPVPDGMFDEPDNGGYAGGGLLAFGGGGDAPLGPYFEAEVKKLFPGAGISGRGRTPERNRQVGGVGNSYHLTNNALDVTPPPGMSLTDFGSALRRHFGPSVDTVFNVKGHFNHAHLEPGPSQARGKSPWWKENPAPSSASGLGALAAPRMAESLEPAMVEGMGIHDKYMPKPKTEARDRLSAEIAERNSPEQQKKDAHEDKWMMLAQLGFGLAASPSPHFLQALGSAAAAALPAARDMKKERRAQRDADIRALAANEDISNKEAREKVLFGLDYAKEKVGWTNKDIAAAIDQERVRVERDKMNAQISEGALDRTNAKDIAIIQANRPTNPDKFDTQIAIVMEANPGWTRLQAMKYLQENGYTGTQQTQSVEDFVGLNKNPAGGGAQVVNVPWPQ